MFIRFILNKFLNFKINFLVLYVFRISSELVSHMLLLSRSVVSNSSQPHGLQPTRLLHPWDFPGKRTGVGCHCCILTELISPSFLMDNCKEEDWNYLEDSKRHGRVWKWKKRKKESEVAHSCPTLCDPTDCSPPGSSIDGILQTRILECIAIDLLQEIFLTQG